MRNKLLEMLTGGDRRSIGRANRVAAVVLAQPKLFPVLVRGMSHEDVLVRMRAADAAEKVSLKRPELLQPFKREMLGFLDHAEDQELRWHLAQMVPRLILTSKERRHAVEKLKDYLDDRSSIVKTSALQGLTDFALADRSLAQEVKLILQRSITTGTPAMTTRSRRLLRAIDGKP